MPKYEMTIVKTYSVKVSAKSEQDAYEAVHNRDEYESCTCVDETTETIFEIEETNESSN
jgi:hypothetical protein